MVKVKNIGFLMFSGSIEKRYHSTVFIVNFYCQHISHFFLVFLMLTLIMCLFACNRLNWFTERGFIQKDPEIFFSKVLCNSYIINAQNIFVNQISLQTKLLRQSKSVISGKTVFLYNLCLWDHCCWLFKCFTQYPVVILVYSVTAWFNTK